MSPRIVITAISCLLAGLSPFFVVNAVQAQETSRAYIVLGGSTDYGFNTTSPEFSYAAQLRGYLETAYFRDKADYHNLAVPGAETKEIIDVQVKEAIDLIKAHDQVAISFGGGGNDLIEFFQDSDSSNCLTGNVDCLQRLNGQLNLYEQAIDRAIGTLREAAGADAVIFIRTQYNPLLRASCGRPEDIKTQLITLIMEGVPAEFDIRGMNDRLRDVAVKHGAKVIDTFLTFYFDPDKYIDSDCIHPTNDGHSVIYGAAITAF